jgi:hypothetical protein
MRQDFSLSGSKPHLCCCIRSCSQNWIKSFKFINKRNSFVLEVDFNNQRCKEN